MSQAGRRGEEPASPLKPTKREACLTAPCPPSTPLLFSSEIDEVSQHFASVFPINFNSMMHQRKVDWVVI